MRFLLDTNVLSEPLRVRPDPAAVEQLKRHRGELATATIVWHELCFGCCRLRAGSKKRRVVETYLDEVVRRTLPIVGYDFEAAAWHARERARLASRGRTPPFADGQIAAIAAVNGLTLVTANAKDYRGFRGVEVVSWASRT